MKKYLVIFALWNSLALADQAATIFQSDCTIIADQTVRDAIVQIAEYYDDIDHAPDPNCRASVVAPSLNNIMLGPVCDFLGSQRSQYDFCKASSYKDPDADVYYDFDTYIADAPPWAQTVVGMVSYTEIMFRNGCFEKIAGNGQNFAQVISNIFGVIQNYSTAGAVLAPEIAGVAIGSRLSMMLFSGIGMLIQAVEEKYRPVNPLIFAGKICGFSKYLTNRQRARCLNGCKDQLAEANTAYQSLMCSISAPKKEFDRITNEYQSYLTLLDQINSFPIQTNTQELSTQQEHAVNSVITAIHEDRNYLARALGFDSTQKFTDTYFDIIDPTDSRLQWLEYSKPSTTIASLKDEINLIMGVPGLIFQDTFCNDPARSQMNHTLFKNILTFNNKEIDSLCDKMGLYYRCGESNGWRDPDNTECQEERKHFEDPDYSIFASCEKSKIKFLMHALQAQKLTQEIKSNNSACFTPEHCNQNKYNCMALLNSYDGISDCGALTNISPEARNIKYLKFLQERDYVALHRRIVDYDIQQITKNPMYQHYLNLEYASQELQQLQQTVVTQTVYEECMKDKHEWERERDCLTEYNKMQEAALTTIDQCIINPETPLAKEYQQLAGKDWESFFNYSQADGNLTQTLKLGLKAKRNPWKEKTKDNADDADLSQEYLDQLARNICETLYCPIMKLNEEFIPWTSSFRLFHPETWFASDNPPILQESKTFRDQISDRCPKVFDKMVEQEVTTREQITQKQQCENMECGGENGMISQLLKRYNVEGHPGLNISFEQCLPAAESSAD